MRIEIDRLDKAFGPTTVLHDIDLEIREREFLGLLGPSGSGKTTLLRILAGLESPDRGGIRFNGRDALSLAPKERRVGFVFQHYALFGHMTVFGNVAFGLHVRPRHDRPARREIADRVNSLLALVQLEGLGDRFPAQLSGGQRQRVALARTLAIEPRVLLLDEPFGALDAKVRIELRRWLREVHETTGLTTVFVTHDQDEALDLADRVAVMNRGRIEQVGTPTEIYESPASPFVYDFLGRSNVFDCAAERGMVRLGDKLLPAERVGDGPALAFVRPHDVVLASRDAPGSSEDATLPGLGTVRFVSVLGPRAWVELAHGNRLIEAEIDRRRLEELELRVGRQYVVRLRLPFVFAAPHRGPDMAGVGRQTQAAS